MNLISFKLGTARKHNFIEPLVLIQTGIKEPNCIFINEQHIKEVDRQTQAEVLFNRVK
jgi:hypothetical protein